jgi:hypothetical protein
MTSTLGTISASLGYCIIYSFYRAALKVYWKVMSNTSWAWLFSPFRLTVSTFFNPASTLSPPKLGIEGLRHGATSPSLFKILLCNKISLSWWASWVLGSHMHHHVQPLFSHFYVIVSSSFTDLMIVPWVSSLPLPDFKWYFVLWAQHFYVRQFVTFTVVL